MVKRLNNDQVSSDKRKITLSSRKKKFQKRFDAVSDRYDDLLHSYCVAKRIAFFKLHSSGWCLEVGAGTGEISSSMDSCDVVVGSDFSFEMVRKMAEKGILGFQSDAESFPVREDWFDTVIAAEVAYYLDEPELLFREVYRVLRPGGQFLLSSFNNHLLVYDQFRKILRFLGKENMYFDDGVDNFMTEKQIRDLAVSVGFTDIRIRKSIVLPWNKADGFNFILERTIFRHLGLFVFLVACK